MSQGVIIKSSKNGISLVLNPEMDFPVLLEEILKKFQESEKFFSNAEFAISFEGRDLSDAEKYQIVDTIMSGTKVKILCIIDNDEIRDAILQQKILEQTRKDEVCKRVNATFYHGSLNPGERIELDEAVIIIGDVPKDAVVISKSSVIVLGTLAGKVYAGIDGENQSFVAALKFMPEQYNIAGIYGETPVKERVSLFSKRSKTTEAKIAFVSDGLMHVRPLDEGLDNYI